MAAPVILLERVCQAQQADRSWVEGLLSVQQEQLSWTPTAGGAAIHIPWAIYNGAKRAKDKPMLMFTHTQPLVVRFASMEDTEAVSKAVASADVAAKAAADAAEAAAAGGGAPAAAAPAAGGAQTARSASPAAAAAAPAAGGRGRGGGAAAGPPSRPGSAGPSGSGRGSAPAAAAAGGGAAAEQQQQPPRSVMPSAAERRNLLNQFPTLLGQYEVLVRGGTLTEEDFWCSPVYARLTGRDTSAAGPPQHTGPSNQLPDITKMVVVTNLKQAKLHVTPELTRQIFDEKPLVEEAFRKHVPSNMTEMEFWERFFRYSRARAKRRQDEVQVMQRIEAPHTLPPGGEEGTGTEAHNASKPDPAEDGLFAGAAQEDAGGAGGMAKARKRRVNPAIDLDANADDGWSEGYGLAHNSARSELDSVKGYKAVSRTLAREYNTHALAVLRGSGIQLSADGASAAASVAAGGVAGSSTAAAKAAAAGGVAGADASEEEVQRLYKDMWTGLEDLQQPVEQQFEELNVTDPRTYFINSSSSAAASSAAAPKKQKTEAAAGAERQPPPSPASVVAALQQVDPCQLPNPPMQPSVAYMVAMQLVGQTSGEEGGRGSSLTPQQALPEPVLEDLRRKSMYVNEVMRHFWALIPVNTEAKFAKFGKLEPFIDKQQGELQQRMKRPQNQETAAANKLLRPIDAQLKAAASGVLGVKKGWNKKTAAAAAAAAGGQPMDVGQ